MWVKYVVPKKRETEINFGVRPIYKSHLNCYGSMISRDISSTVKLLSFRDWKNKISLAEGHYLGTYLDEEGAFSPGPLLKLFTLANGIFIWIVVSFFQTQLTKKFWPQYWIFFVPMHQWFCGKTIINSSVLGSTEKKKGNLFFFLYDLQLQFFLLNFGLEIWEKKGTVTLWQGHIWSRAQLCNTVAHRGHSLGFHVLVCIYFFTAVTY